MNFYIFPNIYPVATNTLFQAYSYTPDLELRPFSTEMSRAKLFPIQILM